MTMSARQRVSNTETSMPFVHRANIEKYERLLKTHLTDVERAFIWQRLEEERRALTKRSTNDPSR